MSESDVQGDTGQQPRWRGFLQLAVIVAVVLAAIFFARAPSREFLQIDPELAQARVEPTAAVIQPAATRASHKVVLTGTVTTLGNVVVVPEVSGDVVWVSENFRSGTEFKADETLAQVDRRDYELRLASAKLALAAAQANLKQRLDEAARAPEFMARFPGGHLNPWLATEGTIEEAEARVGIARNQIALAEIALDETRIRMPFDGYVRTTLLSPGQVVERLVSDVGSVYAKHQLRVRARISAFDLNSLQPVIGRRAIAVADGRAYETVVERVSKEVDIETRLGSLYLEVLDQEKAAMLPPPGTFADVTVEGPMQDDMFVLPESALQINGSVWLVDDGRLTAFTPASVGYSDAGWLVRAFDTRDGIVVGRVPGAREGLGVNAVTAGAEQ
ncbi:MAG: efflux RND transporter periplasmic adaptor subunit [Gammaproteobacteria bacterium]|nr:efflux RND transporter periplasmic adaptor subunit [Gammaproteobacteria bacterium]